MRDSVLTFHNCNLPVSLSVAIIQCSLCLGCSAIAETEDDPGSDCSDTQLVQRFIGTLNTSLPARCAQFDRVKFNPGFLVVRMRLRMQRVNGKTPVNI